MKFLQIDFLWFCLLGLIPWIIYLLQMLLGKPIYIPSLIYIQENRQKKIVKRQNLLIYLLQSLALTLLGLLLAQPILSKGEKAYFCIVDDSLQSQLSSEGWQKIQNQLSLPCAMQFYSASALSQNSFAPLDEKNLNRFGDISWPNILKILEQWPQLSNFENVLIALGENNYDKNLDNYSRLKPLLYPIAMNDKENIFFQNLKVELNPLDYRKRNLYVQLNKDFGSQKKIIIERVQQKTVVQSDDQGEFSMELSVDFNLPLEAIKLSIQGDNYLADNYAFAVIEALQPFAVSFDDQRIPKTVYAIIEQNSKDFAFSWFQMKKGNNSVSLRSFQGIEDLTALNHTLYFFTANGIPRYVNYAGSEFQKGFVAATLDVTKLNLSGYHTLQTFKDSMPAVVKFSSSQSAGGLFLFNPDTAVDALKYSVNYPLFLMHSMLEVLRSSSSSCTHSAANDIDLSSFSKAGMLIQGRLNDDIGEIQRSFLQQDLKNSGASCLAVNYDPSAAISSQIKVPDTKILNYDSNQEQGFFRLWELLLTLFFGLVLLILFLERPKYRNIRG